MNCSIEKFALNLLADNVIQKVDSMYIREKNAGWLSVLAYDYYNIEVIIDFEHDKIIYSFSDGDAVYHTNQINLHPSYWSCLDKLHDAILCGYDFDLSANLD